MTVLAACGGASQTGAAADDAGGATPDLVDASTWQQVVTDADAEGAVVVYSSQVGSEDLFAEFEQAHPGIDVTVDRQPTGDLIPRLDQELQAGAQGADVTFHAQVPWFTERGEQRLLAPLQLSPEVQQAGGYEQVGRYAAPVLKYPFFIAYNTSVAEPVTTIDELATRAAEQGVTVGFLDAGSSIAIKYQYQSWEEAYPGILERLGALNGAVYGSTAPMSQSLAAGEIGYAVGLIPGAVAPLQAQGAPVAEIILTDDAVTGAEDTTAVLANAPHPNAAQVFVNWLMSRELQTRFVEDMAPMVGYLVPSPQLAFDDISTYVPADWPQERQDEFMVGWNAQFLG